jgi:hypothetical protein
VIAVRARGSRAESMRRLSCRAMDLVAERALPW